MWTPANEQLLRATAENWGIMLNNHQMRSLYLLYEEIRSHNTTMNLTRITSEDEFVIKHIVDSLSVLPELLKHQVSNIIDIGTGAGFPGLVVKLSCPELQVTLVDATAKKVTFLNHLIELLRIGDIIALHGPAETLARDVSLREKFDAAVCRALAHMPTLVEICLPFIRVGGILIAQKAKTCEQEVRNSTRAIHELGGEMEKTISLQLPGNTGHRNLVIVRKILASPRKYPRRAGIPRKNPL